MKFFSAIRGTCLWRTHKLLATRDNADVLWKCYCVAKIIELDWKNATLWCHSNNVEEVRVLDPGFFVNSISSNIKPLEQNKNVETKSTLIITHKFHIHHYIISYYSPFTITRHTYRCHSACFICWHTSHSSRAFLIWWFWTCICGVNGKNIKNSKISN